MTVSAITQDNAAIFIAIRKGFLELNNHWVELYTDGACQGNPGPGGWGALLRFKGHVREYNGGEPDTTNNRMELMAVIEGLKHLTRPCHVKVYTDSRYVQQGISQWVHGWKAKGWKTASGGAVKNQDLWEALLEASAPHQIEWHWVKGHAGHIENERADALARAAIPGVSPA